MSDLAAARAHHPDWFRRRRSVRARVGCLTCGGAGAAVPIAEATMDDYCECILQQLASEDEFMALVDGEITVEASDA